MRRSGRQTDECLTIEILLATITGNVGESAFEPDVGLVAAVTMIGDGEIRWNPQQQLGRTFGKISSQHSDLCTGGQALKL